MPEALAATATRPASAAVRPPLAGVAVLSVGAAVPDTVVTTAELAERAGVTEEWMVSRTGIRERRHARPGERVADYATAAGREALERAGIEPAEIDLVLVATMSPDDITPNIAPVVCHALGAHRAGGLDVGAACTGFVGALGMGAGAVESGRARLVLVIGADFISRFTDFSDRSTAALFSDGAGAVVLGATDGESRVGPVILRADGSHARTILATHEEGVIRMDGPEVFRHAVRNMADVVEEAAAAAGVSVTDIDLFVFHQANARILRSIATRMQLDPERIVGSIETLGNNSAATIPLGLESALRDGRLADGARVALAAFGAGFTWGGTVVTWGADER